MEYLDADKLLPHQFCVKDLQLLRVHLQVSFCVKSARIYIRHNGRLHYSTNQDKKCVFMESTAQVLSFGMAESGRSKRLTTHCSFREVKGKTPRWRRRVIASLFRLKD